MGDTHRTKKYRLQHSSPLLMIGRFSRLFGIFRHLRYYRNDDSNGDDDDHHHQVWQIARTHFRHNSLSSIAQIFIYLQVGVLIQLFHKRFAGTTGVPEGMFRFPQRDITDKFVLASPTVSRKSHPSFSYHFRYLCEIAVQLFFGWVQRPGSVFGSAEHSGVCRW